MKQVGTYFLNNLERRVLLRCVRKNEFARFMTKTGMDTLKSSVNLRVTGWITVTRSNNP
jgi:hypothetical protein